MVPINEQPNRLDQMRAAMPQGQPMPQNTAPMPMGNANPPSNTPMGNLPPSPVAGGGGLSALETAAAPVGGGENGRLDELMNAVNGDEVALPEELMAMEEAPLEIATGLADAAVSLAGSIPAAKAELESALAQLDAMEMAEGLA